MPFTLASGEKVQHNVPSLFRNDYVTQSNDSYWHGLFGGLYLSHLRLTTHEHLIAAEDLAGYVDGYYRDSLARFGSVAPPVPVITSPSRTNGCTSSSKLRVATAPCATVTPAARTGRCVALVTTSSYVPAGTLNR